MTLLRRHVIEIWLGICNDDQTDRSDLGSLEEYYNFYILMFPVMIATFNN